MIQKIRKMIRNDKGFTLIELMVVVVILGILAAIAIPSFLGQKASAIDSRKAADIKILQDASDLHNLELGTVPSDLDALVTANYLKELPTDPDAEDGKSYQITAGVVSYSVTQ